MTYKSKNIRHGTAMQSWVSHVTRHVREWKTAQLIVSISNPHDLMIHDG